MFFTSPVQFVLLCFVYNKSLEAPLDIPAPGNNLGQSKLPWDGGGGSLADLRGSQRERNENCLGTKCAGLTGATLGMCLSPGRGLDSACCLY